MSSVYVRTEIKNFIATEFPLEKVIDLSGQYETMDQIIDNEGLAPDDPWLGIEFIANDEVPITVPATNSQGRYREDGAVYFHIVEVASLGNSGTILSRGESLRNKLRGQRIGQIIVESITPLNFGSGATLQFEGGYTSASFVLSYQRDLEL